MLPNRVELLVGLMATWRLGAAATPINPMFTANEAGYQLQDSGAKLLLTSKPVADYGVPKGVMLDHANLVAMGSSIGEWMKLGPSDHCLLVLPLFHVDAILVSCLAPIMVGARAIVARARQRAAIS